MRCCPFIGDFQTFWMSVGVFHEEQYLEWIEAGVISPAKLMRWFELGVNDVETIKKLKYHNINTPDELQRKLIGRWRFGLPYSVQELLIDLSNEFDEFDEFPEI